MNSKLVVAIVLVVCASASRALAHTSLEQGGTHMSRYGDGNSQIKTGPCGTPGGARGTHVYTYAPGETITITVKEFISHSGYYRIAFDNDGDDGFADPVSIAPANGRTCTSNADDHCGEDDFFNNDTVLMDNLNPHTQAIFTMPTYTWEVTLPDVECDNCTLQIIQVMTESGKAPYDPSGAGADDIYYQCIDLVLQADGEAGAGGTGAAGTGAAGTSAGTGGSGGSGSGGTSGTGAAGSGGSTPPVTAGTGAATPPMTAGAGGTTMQPSAGTGVPVAGTGMQAMGQGGSGSSGGCDAAGKTTPGNALAFALSALLPLAWMRRRRGA